MQNKITKNTQNNVKTFNAQIKGCLNIYENGIDYLAITLISETSQTIKALMFENDINERLLSPNNYITVTGAWKLINNQRVFHIGNIQSYQNLLNDEQVMAERLFIVAPLFINNKYEWVTDVNKLSEKQQHVLSLLSSKKKYIKNKYKF